VHNVIVTGGSRGLGLAISSTLAAAGYRVVAIARSRSPELAAAIETYSRAQAGALEFRPFDLMNTAGIAGLIDEIKRQVGPIYGLVNNAGIGVGGVLTMMRDEQIEALTRLNLFVPMLLTKYALRSMMVERAGRIVNVSSIVSATGVKGLAAYAATKAGLVGFTRSLAREVGELGITVNAVAPGFVATEMTREMTEEQRERIIRRSALGRLAEADDVAAAVEYLLGDKAKNVTGVTLTIDAGATA
jgi:3-oxoacyl-[acyl-carrier protein] reductase